MMSQQAFVQQGHSHSVPTAGQNVVGLRPALCKFNLDLNDVLIVLIDHQNGLLNLVRDMDVSILRTNVLTLAKAAQTLNIPVVLTATDEEGPNGFLLPEFESVIPDAVFVKRTGMANPWENANFVKAIESTGKHTLIMAGTLANVCLAAPAISAACAGYTVYTVIDASGATDKSAREIALHRLIVSNVIPIDTIAMIAELLKNNPRVDQQCWWELIGDVMPEYKLLVDSFKGPGFDKPSTIGKTYDPRLKSYSPSLQQQREGEFVPKYKERFNKEPELYTKESAYGKAQDISTGRYEKEGRYVR